MPKVGACFYSGIGIMGILLGILSHPTLTILIAVFLIYPYVQRSDCLLESYKQVTMNGVSFCVRQVIMNGANFCVPLKLLHFEPISATEPFQEFHVYALKIVVQSHRL